MWVRLEQKSAWWTDAREGITPRVFAMGIGSDSAAEFRLTRRLPSGMNQISVRSQTAHADVLIADCANVIIGNGVMEWN